MQDHIQQQTKYGIIGTHRSDYNWTMSTLFNNRYEKKQIYWENIMKRKLITTILTLSLCLSCFTACSFNAKKVSDNIGKGNESDLPEERM